MSDDRRCPHGLSLDLDCGLCAWADTPPPLRLPNPDAAKGAEDQPFDASDYERPEPYLTRFGIPSRDEMDPKAAAAIVAAIAAATMVERARCRRIVLRLFGRDWKGNEALDEIDGKSVG